MGHMLSPVIVTATGAMKLSKADTIPELIRNGFYVREETNAAGTMAGGGCVTLIWLRH